MPPSRQIFRPPRFDHREVEAYGLRLHYVEVDAPGPPLLLLHGIGMDWRVWQALSRRLAPYFHLYLLDFRGHGSSDKPPTGYTVAHYAGDVEDVIERVRLTDVTVVGSSLGAMVAASIEAPPDVIGHRILVDPPLTGGPIRDVPMFEQILRLKHGPVNSLADYLAESNPGAGRYYLRTMAEMWHAAADGVIEDMLSHSDTFFDIDHALTLIESPTLIVQADPALGGVLSNAQAERAVRLLPHGSLRSFPGTGHAVHAFVPDKFTALVADFVDVDSGSVGGAPAGQGTAQ